MKKISFAVNIILLVIVLFLIIYDRPASMIPFDNEQKESAYGIKDYPLVDFPIRYNESEVILIIANNVMQFDKAEYLYTNNKKTLEDMQTVFNVITFPADRGTTPDSMVYIYEDNVLIKEIPFFDTYSNDEQFNLSNLNKQEVEKILKQELPPAV